MKERLWLAKYCLQPSPQARIEPCSGSQNERPPMAVFSFCPSHGLSLCNPQETAGTAVDWRSGDPTPGGRRKHPSAAQEQGGFRVTKGAKEPDYVSRRTGCRSTKSLFFFGVCLNLPVYSIFQARTGCRAKRFVCLRGGTASPLSSLRVGS